MNAEINNNNHKPSKIIEAILNTYDVNKTEQETYFIKKESSGGLKPEVIAAIVVACIVGVLACACICFFLLYKGVKREVS